MAQLRTALLQPARTSLADEAEDLANELWGTPRDTLSLQRQASQELKITSATAASAAAAPMASARMCAELAMLADEKGDNADAIDHYTEAVEWYLKALKLEPDEKEKAAALPTPKPKPAGSKQPEPTPTFSDDGGGAMETPVKSSLDAPQQTVGVYGGFAKFAKEKLMLFTKENYSPQACAEARAAASPAPATSAGTKTLGSLENVKSPAT